MARAIQWTRSITTGADGFTSANIHKAELATLTDGQTLTRIRFRYTCVHVPSVAANEAAGLGVAIGIGLRPQFLDPYETLLPIDYASTADWVWWEMPWFTPTLGASPTAEVAEVDIAPLYDQYRDAKAQRSIIGTQTLWFISQTPQLGAAQTEHYLSVSASVLALDAP